uniref:Uncharacterized protein n=1 Tax=uncultured verrucomicrobium HF0500_18J03 TaxID=723599 RepID=E7C5A8_9BACT|nr:hypothetical protein [uncultured verrucomicrobium HF0500_18J03]
MDPGISERMGLPTHSRVFLEPLLHQLNIFEVLSKSILGRCSLHHRMDSYLTARNEKGPTHV